MQVVLWTILEESNKIISYDNIYMVEVLYCVCF